MGKYWQLFLWSQRDTIFLFLKCSKMLAYRENGLIASRWWRRGIKMYSIRSDKPKIELAPDVGPHIGVMKVWYNLTGRSKIAKFWFDKLFLSRKVEGIPTADMNYCPSQPSNSWNKILHLFLFCRDNFDQIKRKRPFARFSRAKYKKCHLMPPPPPSIGVR